MNKSKSIRKRKHVLQGRKTNKTKKKYQVTKNLFIQSGGVKLDFYLPIPEHQIPSLINLVSKHANTAKKILHKDDRARRNDVIDRILQFPNFHKYEILIAMLEFPNEYRYIFEDEKIKELFNSSIHCRHFISCLNFANATKINFLLDLYKPLHSIPNHNLIQIIGIHRPLYILYLDIDIKEIKFTNIGIRSKDSEININLIDIYSFLFQVKNNSLIISEENITTELIKIRDLLTLVPSLEANYTYQLSGTKQQIINTGTLYNYILSVLCPNQEIVKILSTTQNQEIQSLFRKLPTVAIPAVNSLTLDSSRLTDIEIVGSLERIFRQHEYNLVFSRRNFEFLYLPRLCNRTKQPAPEIFQYVIRILDKHNKFQKGEFERKNKRFEESVDEYYHESDDYFYAMNGGPEQPDYQEHREYTDNFYHNYKILLDIIDNLLDTLNGIPYVIQEGNSLLDIYLTREIYDTYSDLFHQSKSKYDRTSNYLDGGTIPFSWIKKHPDIFYSKFTNESSKYKDEPEFQIIREIYQKKWMIL